VNHAACKMFALILVCCAVTTAEMCASDPAFPLQAKRILFLGDSITHAGEYVNLIELQCRLQGISPLPEMVNVGLASETCSGLSEPDHPFPRPDVHERLDRALAAVRPDVVVACYGMNDGIYHPFSEERFQIYQNGIQRLVEKARAAGAKIVLMTPPPYDAEPLKGTDKIAPAGKDKYAYFQVYEGYDEVIHAYGQWIVSGSTGADMVIDLHTPLTNYVLEQRKASPKFTLAPDGVHCNSEGHRMIALTVLKAWGLPDWKSVSPEAVQLAKQRGGLLHDAWLSHVGHKRPGTAAGMPLEEAQAKAKAIEADLVKALSQTP
jgi:lysophospholipase L1-like esterase